MKECNFTQELANFLNTAEDAAKVTRSKMPDASSRIVKFVTIIRDYKNNVSGVIVKFLTMAEYFELDKKFAENVDARKFSEFTPRGYLTDRVYIVGDFSAWRTEYLFYFE